MSLNRDCVLVLVRRHDGQKKLFVTQPSLPPLDEFIPYLEQIWSSQILTNGGPMHQRLEQLLCEYLGVEHLALFNNGTSALLVALQSLRINGEVITTPYSFVTTAHSLLWRGIKPVFVDIDPLSMNLDPALIEAAITPQTTAIMPVHCYGGPCAVEQIKQIADSYNLRVIYDAAHAFGVRDAGGSVLRHGDLSVLSFHATKVFNTFEGGAIVCPDAQTKQRIDQLKNFGITDEVSVVAAGINGKMHEVSAAFGLLQLEHIEQSLAARQQIDTQYRVGLADIAGIRCVPLFVGGKANYSYFPILVDPQYSLTRDELYELLKSNEIYARRYFYPLISSFSMYQNMASAAQGNLPNATRVSASILCLPIYPDLSGEDVDRIIDIIRRAT